MQWVLRGNLGHQVRIYWVNLRLRWKGSLPWEGKIEAKSRKIGGTYGRQGVHQKSWAVLRPLCEFPLAVVTNHHKRGGLKQHRCILLQTPEVRSPVLVSLGSYQGVGRAASFQRPQGRVFPSFFQLLVTASIPWLVAVLLRLPFPEDSCDDIRAHPDHLEPSPHLRNVIISASSPFPYKVTFTSSGD